MTSPCAPSLERRGRSRSGIAAWPLALALIGVTTSRAARAEVDLQWIAPAECPREETVREKIRSLAGVSLEELDRLSAEGEITRVDGRYRLKLRVRLGSEVREREIDSEVCADLAGAAAVTLGLLLKSATPEAQGTGGDGAPGGTGGASSAPGGAGAAAGTTPAAKPGAAAPTRPENDPRRPDAPREPRAADRARLGIVLRAPVAALDVGPLPQPGFDLGGGGGLEYAGWQLVLSGRFGPSQRIARASLGGSGATVRRLAAEASVCRGFRGGALELAPCLVVALEHVTTSGFGRYVVPRSRQAAWVAPGAGVLARLHAFESLSLVAGATGYVHVSRPQLVITDVGEVDRLAPVALRVLLGTDWIF
jgi:hypothetical protein